MAEKISIIIPTLNEEGNVELLIQRLVKTLESNNISGEIIFIDDHSKDNTRDLIIKSKKRFSHVPIKIFLKKAALGKAQSLIEGFGYSKHDVLAIIDADLQYPPEAIGLMFEKIIKQKADIVVANRRNAETSVLRKITSKSFKFLFAEFLHGLTCDVQSGLKVFKKEIIDGLSLNPSPWTFDMEFLLNARNHGYAIDSFDITFEQRKFGKSKINVAKAAVEIGWNALVLKFKEFVPRVIKSETNSSMRDCGIMHGQKRFITHTTLDYRFSALDTFTNRQKFFLIIITSLFFLGLINNPLLTGITFLAFLSALYFIDVVFSLILVIRSLKNPPEIEISREKLLSVDDSELPMYSILCPLYKEKHMIAHFLQAIEKIQWPKEKLEVLLLLEENDEETIQQAQSMNLPQYIKVIVVPHSLPKTKPKACNYGLTYATGEYIVIFDAEDRPDPDQLKKAYLAFQNLASDVICLQAKLNYFNPNQNWLTRFFTAEYSLWFDVTLPGLQTINTAIPLGGTSNHFRTKDLIALKGWDPFNVTEDCDLGVRLFMKGYKTAVINSTTLEEANSDVKNWLRQRSRWIKGYMQTYLTHMRKPVDFFKKNKWHALIFQLVVGGKISFMLINPFLWIMTISYFSLNSLLGPTIRSLYPTIVFYMAVVSLVFGNFLYLYCYMIGSAKRKHYFLMRYVIFIPFYWVMVSAAAGVATYQLFVRPHYWEKTNHGLHLFPQKKNINKKKIVFSPVFNGFSDYFLNFKKAISKLLLFDLKDFIFSGKSVLIAGIFLNNFLNFLFNAFLARTLSYSQLSLVILISTIWYVATIFIGGFANTVNHQTSNIIAKKSSNAAMYFLQNIIKKGALAAVIFSAIWIACSYILADFFHLNNFWVLVFFAPAFLFGLLSSSYEGFLRGNLRFQWSAIVIIAETVSKLFIAAVLVFFEKGELVYLSIPLALAISAIVGKIFIKKLSIDSGSFAAKSINFSKNFFLSTILTNISTIVFLSIDIILVKHFFSEEISGQYSILSLAGKMIYFFGTLPLVFMIPYVSRIEQLHQNSKHFFRKIFSVISLLVMLGVVVFGFFGSYSVPFLFGGKANEISKWLFIYSISIGLFTIANTIAVYRLAKKNYLFSYAILTSSILLIFGFGFFHSSLDQIVQVYFFSSLFTFVVLAVLHYFNERIIVFVRALIDLKGVFVNGLPDAKIQVSGKNILIFNWRDITHSFAGGAEIYIHEISRTLVKQGNCVTLFCGNDGKQKRYETIDGIDIIRRGGFYLVYIWAFLYYIFRFRGKYDIVIDCENGIPFFAPLYVRVPVFGILHHVHQSVFLHSLARPVALFASFLEKDLMPLVYKKVKFITVSQSSKKEMENLGIGKAGIKVIHPGIDSKEFSEFVFEKTPYPSILFLGRLKAYKSVDILIEAFSFVVDKIPTAKLIIAGSGDEEEKLKKLTQELNLIEKVEFLGKITKRKKVELLQSCWVLVNTSLMEGWGIVVIEANACGTPVIASDVPGLRDSVQNGKGGFLVPYGDVTAFAKKIISVIEDEKKRKIMGIHGKNWAGNFSWEKSGKMFLAAITESLGVAAGENLMEENVITKE